MRNGTGTYNLPAGNPVITGTVIDSVWANTTLSDIAAELTNSIAADGQTPMVAPLRLASGTAVAPGLTFNAELSMGIFRAGSATLAFSTNGVERARLVGANLLIGSTTDTGERLQVTGTTKFDGAVTMLSTLTLQPPSGASTAATRDYVDTGTGRYMTVTNSTSVAAVANQFYTVTATGSATTVTLPASPANGVEVWVQNATGRRDLVIARNGNLIAGLAEDFEVNVPAVTVKLRFIDGTIGWRFV